MENAIGFVKYVIAALTIFGGITAILTPLTPLSGPLGFLYGTRVGLVLFGLLTIACGLALLYGKVRKSRKWTGIGLMACYCCFLFATLIQISAFGFHPAYWAVNGTLAILSGALWLRWKFKTAYINPNHFRKDIAKLKN